MLSLSLDTLNYICQLEPLIRLDLPRCCKQLNLIPRSHCEVHFITEAINPLQRRKYQYVPLANTYHSYDDKPAITYMLKRGQLNSWGWKGCHAVDFSDFQMQIWLYNERLHRYNGPAVCVTIEGTVRITMYWIDNVMHNNQDRSCINIQSDQRLFEYMSTWLGQRHESCLCKLVQVLQTICAIASSHDYIQDVWVNDDGRIVSNKIEYIGSTLASIYCNQRVM
jgi:hypothetical protein